MFCTSDILCKVQLGRPKFNPNVFFYSALLDTAPYTTIKVQTIKLIVQLSGSIEECSLDLDARVSTYYKRYIYTVSGSRTDNNMHHSPVLLVYTPMYMVWVTFVASGTTQM